MKKRKNITIHKLDAGSQENVKLGYIEYNEQGNRTKEIQYGADGTIESELTKEYNDQGKMTLQLLSAFGEEQSRMETSWDKEGYRLEEKIYQEGEQLQQHKQYSWNENHSKLTLSYLDEEGNVLNTESNEYNEKGEAIIERVLDEEGEVLESYKYFYENGELVKKIAHFNGFDSVYVYEYEKDDQGRLVLSRITDDDGEEEQVEIEYQENGKKSEETKFNINGSYETTFYDEDERETKVNRYDETDFLVYESSSFYKDDSHQYVSERNIRRDNQVMKLTYHYEFYE